MQSTIETSSCGYTLKFAGPDSIEAYDAKAGKPGAALEHALLYTVYREILVTWQEAFAQLLAAKTGIPRQIDEEATARAKSQSKHPENVAPINERVLAYNKRVASQWANGDDAKRAELQAWAQEVADKIEAVPSPVTPPEKQAPIGKADLAKAAEILSHPSDYIEERVALMLSELPDYELLRDAGNENKPDLQSLARLINRYIVAKLKL
jgi:hypothetical protein